MVRSLVALFVVAALISLAPAAPVPKHLTPKETLYHGVQKGSRWVYADTGAEVVFEATDARPDKRGGSVVTIDRVENGKKTLAQKLDVSPRGIFLIEGPEGTRKPPTCLLQCPVQADTKWSIEYTGRPNDTNIYRATLKITGTEDVTVPAGKYAAVRVEAKISAFAGDKPVYESNSTTWYAPGIGVVKQEGRGWTKELKSFTPGKD
ncbi:hypothetical protein J8F10_13440 [Gemmata sp. G18]|uniref:DUF3108 domain-containing protein n=1 Tax=Gemmata palustris TaxID=2822762 RepID=A0ABS5BRI4_9BACT|nr:hypothetical protein [Gemmata palustris]MBP3956288.1 hypothetical protein [Gemmata palustris]